MKCCLKLERNEFLIVLRRPFLDRECTAVYSARGACRVDAGKFTCVYRQTAVNACKLRLGPFYMRTAGKVTCVCRLFCTHQFYSVRQCQIIKVIGHLNDDDFFSFLILPYIVEENHFVFLWNLFSRKDPY